MGYNTRTGLNVYQIIPLNKHYSIGGIDNNGTSFRLIGGNSTSGAIAVDTYTFGLASPRAYYATTTTGTPNTNLYIDYVDSTGNLVENSGPHAIVATAGTTLPVMIGGPIKLRTSTSIGNTGAGSAHTLFISALSGGDTTRTLCCSNLANYGIAVFTVPNGYIGYINTLCASFSTTGSLIIVKWDTASVRQVIYKVNIDTALNIVVPAGSEGLLGGILYPGESIGFTHNLATVNKVVQASVLLRPI